MFVFSSAQVRHQSDVKKTGEKDSHDTEWEEGKYRPCEANRHRERASHKGVFRVKERGFERRGSRS